MKSFSELLSSYVGEDKPIRTANLADALNALTASILEISKDMDPEQAQVLTNICLMQLVKEMATLHLMKASTDGETGRVHKYHEYYQESLKVYHQFWEQVNKDANK